MAGVRPPHEGVRQRLPGAAVHCHLLHLPAGEGLHWDSGPAGYQQGLLPAAFKDSSDPCLGIVCSPLFSGVSRGWLCNPVVVESYLWIQIQVVVLALCKTLRSQVPRIVPGGMNARKVISAPTWRETTAIAVFSEWVGR